MENHGKRWNDDDIKYIFSEIKKGNDQNIIAEHLKRTPVSISGKLYQIINILINIVGIDINTVSELINIPSNDITEYFNKYKKTSDKDTCNISKDTCNQINEENIIDKNIKPEIILNKKQQIAFEEFKKGKNIFITGPAGTGKSMTISKIIDYCKKENKNYGITATTGASALLINGKTIHSYLGIGLAHETPTELFKKVKYKYKNIISKICNLNVLIIDEISMMNNELFDKISNFLCLCRKSREQFGGIQIVLTGDFCQLESVNGDYCFNSESWKKLNLEVIFLNKMIRQNEDKSFKKILKDLRYGICSDDTFNKLLEYKDTVFTNIKPTILYPRNVDVDKINSLEYNKLIENNAKVHNYTIILPELKKNHDKIKKWIKSLDIQDSIELCVGAQIVITANINQDKMLVNGTRGIIIELLPDKIIIKKINGTIDTIEYYKCIYNEDPMIYFKYMPIKLAYALTIHKSQGMTIDAIEIDIGDKIFASGQAYTALSRARTLDNIKIKDISKNSFIINKSVIDFYKQYDNTL